MARCPVCHHQVSYLRNTFLKSRYVPNNQATCQECHAALRVKPLGTYLAVALFFASIFLFFNFAPIRQLVRSHWIYGTALFLADYAVIHYLSWLFFIRFSKIE